MQPTTLLSSQNSTVPFEKGRYTGQVNVSILEDSNSSAIYIRVIGERITLENFQGRYSGSLKNIFSSSRSVTTSEPNIFFNEPGYEPGESQSGLIIEEGHRGKGYGKEAICLAAAAKCCIVLNKLC